VNLRNSAILETWFVKTLTNLETAFSLTKREKMAESKQQSEEEMRITISAADKTHMQTRCLKLVA
jgi:hypothetical protein